MKAAAAGENSGTPPAMKMISYQDMVAPVSDIAPTSTETSSSPTSVPETYSIASTSINADTNDAIGNDVNAAATENTGTTADTCADSSVVAVSNADDMVESGNKQVVSGLVPEDACCGSGERQERMPQAAVYVRDAWTQSL